MKKLVIALSIALVISLCWNLTTRTKAEATLVNNGDQYEQDILEKIRQHASQGRKRIELFDVRIVTQDEQELLVANVVGTTDTSE